MGGRRGGGVGQVGRKSYTWSEITSMILDQNCSKMLWVRKPNLPHKSFLGFYFFEIWFVTLNKSWNHIGWIFVMLLSHGLGKRSDLEKRECNSLINRTAESQSDYNYFQWIKNECYRSEKHEAVDRCTHRLRTHAWKPPWQQEKYLFTGKKLVRLVCYFAEKKSFWKTGTK